MIVARKIVMIFPAELVDQPIICRLVKEYDLEFNILKAAVTQKEEGLLVLELKGEEDQYEKGLSYLNEIGVVIQPLSKDVVLLEEQCVSCGACIPHCPTAALVVDPENMKVVFRPERCIACEVCVQICPYKAMETRW